jgi:hypothetical protein
LLLASALQWHLEIKQLPKCLWYCLGLSINQHFPLPSLCLSDAFTLLEHFSELFQKYSKSTVSFKPCIILEMLKFRQKLFRFLSNVIAICVASVTS